MSVEFDYSLDEKTAEPKLSFSKGTLNDVQQAMLIDEIRKQQIKLMGDESGCFKPQSPILGLPEDIAFKYNYRKDSPPRFPIFNMSWEGTTTESFQEQKGEHISPDNFMSSSLQERKEDVQKYSYSNSHSVDYEGNEKLKQQDWVTSYVESLTQRLNSLPHDSLDRSAEKAGLDYAVTELHLFLASNNENSALLLFSAYLHFAVTHFWQIDRDKASLFLLATRSIESETDTDTDTKSPAQTSKNITVDDSFDKNRSLFAKIFQRFFSGKGF